MAYGPEVKLDTAYGLTNTQGAVKAVSYGLRWSSAVTGDLTCRDWPVTGQKVRRITTIIESTWNKRHVRMHDDEIYTLVIVLLRYLIANTASNGSIRVVRFEFQFKALWNGVSAEERHNLRLVVMTRPARNKQWQVLVTVPASRFPILDIYRSAITWPINLN